MANKIRSLTDLPGTPFRLTSQPEGDAVTVLEILVGLLLLIGSALVLRTLREFDALAAPPVRPERRPGASASVRGRAA
jgi:hypothetical protein